LLLDGAARNHCCWTGRREYTAAGRGGKELLLLDERRREAIAAGRGGEKILLVDAGGHETTAAEFETA